MREAEILDVVKSDVVCSCGNIVKKNSIESRKIHKLAQDLLVKYSCHICACGKVINTYDEAFYPPGDNYAPEVKEQIKLLRNKKGLSLNEVKERMKKEYNLDISIGSIRNWTK